LGITRVSINFEVQKFCNAFQELQHFQPVLQIGEVLSIRDSLVQHICLIVDIRKNAQYSRSVLVLIESVFERL